MFTCFASLLLHVPSSWCSLNLIEFAMCLLGKSSSKWDAALRIFMNFRFQQNHKQRKWKKGPKFRTSLCQKISEKPHFGRGRHFGAPPVQNPEKIYENVALENWRHFKYCANFVSWTPPGDYSTTQFSTLWRGFGRAKAQYYARFDSCVIKIFFFFPKRREASKGLVNRR